MRPKAITEELSAAQVTGTPVVIAGDKGTGKSSVVESYAREKGLDMLLSHPVTWDPTDVKGLPAADLKKGEGKWLAYGDLLMAVKANKPTVWFHDDLGQAPQAVQASLMQIYLTRRIGDHKISPHIQLIAATNRVKDRAGVGMPLAPLKDRARILQLDTNIDDWSEWAAGNGVSPSIIGYINFRPEHLHSCTPVNDWEQDGSTPRGLERVSKRMDVGIPANREAEVIAGDIGLPVASEFIAYMRIYRDLPDLAMVEKSPEKTKLPTDLSAKYAVACALAARGTAQTVGAHETYLSRLVDGKGVKQREFRLLYWRQMVTRDKSMVNTGEFRTFTKDFKDIMLSA